MAMRKNDGDAGEERRGLRLLDGGMGHLLRRLGVTIEGEIGSMRRFLGVALANTEEPELVKNAHLQYLEAGAGVITTNSYSCVPACISLADKGDEGEGAASLVTDLIEAACMRALEARTDYLAALELPPSSPPLVAGCVPPLHESYRADRCGGDEEMVENYTAICGALKPHCDLLLCETMSCVREGVVAATTAAKTGLPVWVSFTLDDDGSGNLRSGEPIRAAAEAIKAVPEVEAVLLNCCSHASIKAALPIMREVLGAAMGVGAYANGFETVKATGGGADDPSGGASEYQRDLTPARYAGQAQEWRELGADIVGGCCGVFPEHIRALRPKDYNCVPVTIAPSSAPASPSLGVAKLIKKGGAAAMAANKFAAAITKSDKD